MIKSTHINKYFLSLSSLGEVCKEKMKKILYIALFSIVLTGCYSASRIVKKDFPEISRDERLLVAVVDFTNSTGDESNDAFVQGIYGKMVNALSETQRFRLIERQKLEDVLSELKLQMTGLTDSSTAQEVGRLLGVDGLIFGELPMIKYERSKQSIFIMWAESKKIEVSLQARLVDVETGEVRASANTSAFVKQRTWVAFWVARLGSKMDKNSLIEKGLELVCTKAAQDLAERAY
ncbi:MAG: hypothetical protein GF384_07100 [Elusimicrobia bacterium]|nr:hypothetical protein [Elusimicrobiota bacterium]